MQTLCHLRSQCNNRGLSCRSKSGKYLTRSALLQLLKQQHGGQTLALKDSMFYDIFHNDDEEDGVISEEFNVLPHNHPFKSQSYLGRGDQADVYLARSGEKNYAIKIYRKFGMPDEVGSNTILQSVGVAPMLWYVGSHGDTDFTISDVYDVTLKDYLKEHPALKPHYIEMCCHVLRNLIRSGYNDYDFKLDNVMINRDTPDKLYFIDADIREATDEPEEVKENLEYWHC